MLFKYSCKAFISSIELLGETSLVNTSILAFLSQAKALFGAGKLLMSSVTSSSTLSVTYELQTVLFPQVRALASQSSQAHIQISILSYSYHLSQAFTIAHHLSATSHIPTQSRYIFVQNAYFEGAASIHEKTAFQEAQ
jgi:hypothetical protein